MATKKKGKVPVTLTLPVEAIKAIDWTVKTGLLGTTRDEVIEHILRQRLHDDLILNLKVQVAREEHAKPESP